MKIQKLIVRNFRSIKFQEIDFQNYNTFVGPNSSGKSTFLHALNVFFGEIRSFTEDDFWNRDTTNSIEIAVTFSDFSDAATDVFKHYIRHGKMTVAVEIAQQGDNNFQLTMMGERLVNPDFARFFDLPKSPVSERKAVYESLRESYEGLPSESSGTAMEAALREFEEAMPETDKTALRSADEFFGASKGVDKFRQFLTWVYVPAVKDASAESEEGKNTHLGRLIQHTVRSSMSYEEELESIRADARRRYEDLLKDQQHHLGELETRLHKRLQESVTSDAGITLKWRSDEKSVTVNEPSAAVQLRDKGFTGDVGKFGHGLQRAFLLVILQELLRAGTEEAPTLILGCEEPELYQHPPQARHLASVLSELSKGETQIILTTHSPYFVDIDSLTGLRKTFNRQGFTETNGGSIEEITEAYNAYFDDAERKIEALRAKLCIQMQPKTNEIFFSDYVVLVEGISDQACLYSYLSLSDKMKTFQKRGCNIVEAGGKSPLIMLQLLARQFAIPYYLVFDCDGQEQDAGRRARHAKDNLTAFALVGHQTSEAFPQDDICNERLTAWKTNIEDAMDEDLGELRDKCLEVGRRAAGHLKDCRKNPIFIAAMMQEAWDKGCRFVRLGMMVDKIIDGSLLEAISSLPTEKR